MTMVEKLYTVKLTEQEIDYLTTALHGEYKTVRDRIRADYAGKAIPDREFERISAVRDLRNSFAGLVGRRYMGEDA